MRILTSTLLALLALGSAVSFGATLKVPSQFPTIAAAEAAASNGDTIAISRGRYQENVVSTKSLKFFGVPGTIWDGNIGAVRGDQLSVTANNVTVRNIEFQNGNQQLTINGDNPVVSNCRFQGADFAGASPYAILLNCVGGTAASVTNCFVTSIDANNLIEVNSNGAVVRNNRLLSCDGDLRVTGNNARVERNVLDTIEDQGTICVSGDNAIVSRNRVANTNDDGIVVSGNDVTVTNNVLRNLAADRGICVSGNDATVSGNTVGGLNSDDDVFGIEVSGDNPRVLQNRVSNIMAGCDYGAWGICVSSSTTATVLGNNVRVVGGYDEATGIEVFSNTAATVSRNRVSDILGGGDDDGYGVFVNADNAVVSANRIDHCTAIDAGLRVRGDNYTITGNRISNIGDDTCGLELFQSTTNASGGGTISGNRVSNVADDGYDLSGIFGATVNNNVAVRVGSEGQDSFCIFGDDNLFQSNRVLMADDNGFIVCGDRNTFFRCVVIRSARDGFDISCGSDNVVDRCRGTNCGGEGLDNGGTDTIVTRSVFKKNRIDVAKDGIGTPGNPGSFATFTGNIFSTGGTTTPQEID